MTRRLIWSLTLFAWCVELVTLPGPATPVRAAPVPKAPPPVALTPELVTGTWLYAWGGWPDGVISFAADGTYVARHDPHSDTVYLGTWCVSGDTVSIFEQVLPAGAAAPSETCTRYDFKFDLKGYPKLTGRSNGSVDVAIWNRRR